MGQPLSLCCMERPRSSKTNTAEPKTYNTRFVVRMTDLPSFDPARDGFIVVDVESATFLSEDTLLLLMTYLEASDRLRARLVCRAWKDQDDTAVMFWLKYGKDYYSDRPSTITNIFGVIPQVVCAFGRKAGGVLCCSLGLVGYVVGAITTFAWWELLAFTPVIVAVFVPEFVLLVLLGPGVVFAIPSTYVILHGWGMITHDNQIVSPDQMWLRENAIGREALRQQAYAEFYTAAEHFCGETVKDVPDRVKSANVTNSCAETAVSCAMKILVDHHKHNRNRAVQM